ncbi:MFS transporter [Halorubrum trueperi]
MVACGTLLRELIRLILSPLLPTLIEDFSISPGLAGIALSLLGALGALFQYPGGRLSDRLTRKTVFQFTFVGIVFGCTVLLYSPTYLVFLFGITIVGVAVGLYPAAAAAQISDAFTEKRGQMLGLNVAAASFGGILSTVIVLLVLPITSWQFVFFPIIVFSLVMVVFTHTTIRGGYVLKPVNLGVVGVSNRILKTPRLRLIIVASSMFSLTWQGVLGFLPTILQVEKGFTEMTATLAFGSLFVIGLFANPLAGVIGDRIQYQIVAVTSTALTAVGIGLVFFSSGVLTFGIGLVVLGVGLASYWPVVAAYLIGILTEGNLGGDYGAARSIYLLIGSTGPFLVGIVSGQVGYSWSLVGLCVCAVGSSAIWVYLSVFE